MNKYIEDIILHPEKWWRKVGCDYDARIIRNMKIAAHFKPQAFEINIIHDEAGTAVEILYNRSYQIVVYYFFNKSVIMCYGARFNRKLNYRLFGIAP